MWQGFTFCLLYYMEHSLFLFEINEDSAQIEMHIALFYSYFGDKGDYSTADLKALRWPSVGFTPHPALSVMKNEKRIDKDTDYTQKTNQGLNKCNLREYTTTTFWNLNL